MRAIQARARTLAEQMGLPADLGVVVEWAPEAGMMAEALRLVGERWGGMREWALAHGVTEDDIAALRAALIEESPAPA
jgi:hypothetical protein